MATRKELINWLKCKIAFNNIHINHLEFMTDTNNEMEKYENGMEALHLKRENEALTEIKEILESEN